MSALFFVNKHKFGVCVHNIENCMTYFLLVNVRNDCVSAYLEQYNWFSSLDTNTDSTNYT